MITCSIGTPCFISSATYSRIPPKMNLKRIVTSSHSPLSLGWGSGRVILCRTILMVFKNDPHTKGDLTCLLTHLQKINYFNADHTHALIDLPTRYSIEEVIKLFKGGSSYWINHSRLIKGRFAWGLGYGAFSVSHSDVGRVARYIADQDEHHRKRTYSQ